MGCSMVDEKKSELIPLNQQWALRDVGRKNLTSQQSGSNSSVKKLRLLICKGGVFWTKNIKAN